MEYIMRNVRLDEFVKLKAEEQTIVTEAKNSFNDYWKPKVDNIDVTFRYNPGRSSVGIFVRKGEQPELVLDSEGLTKEQDAMVSSLYGTLEKKLTRMRLPAETWVDSVTENRES